VGFIRRELCPGRHHCNADVDAYYLPDASGPWSIDLRLTARVCNVAKIGVISHLRHAIREPFAGGLEMHTHALCTRLRESGHDVTLFAASGSSDPGLQAISAPVCISDENFAVEHRTYLALMVELKSRSFDIIHNNALHYLPVAMADTLPMPMITTLHTPPFWELEGSMRLSQSVTHCYVAVSDAIRRAWQPVAPVDQVIPNGIDLDLFEFREVPDVEPYLIWFGRIVPEKGLHLAMAAARRAGMKLRFAGPILDDAYYNERIAPAIDDTVCYLGHLAHADLVASIAGARAFLFTPLWDEPYGLVVAEALACGTPVAAFARGAVPDLLDESCGVLVEPNDVQGLAAAALSAQHLDRPACRRRALSIGDGRVMIGRYEDLYRDMLRLHPRTQRHIAHRSLLVPSLLASIDPTNASLIDLYARKIHTMLCPLPVDETVSCPH